MRTLWAAAACIAAAGCGRPGDPGPPLDRHAFQPMCTPAWQAASNRRPLLKRDEISPADPLIVRRGPPVRIVCAVTTPDRDIGTVTADVLCLDPGKLECVRVEAALVPSQRIDYRAPDAAP